MKTLPSLMICAAALAGNALALTPIVENFNGSKLDKTRWYEFRRGTGRMKVADKKLNFVTSNPTTVDDFASAELTASQPGYNESWELIVDLSNSFKTGKNAACGIMLANNFDRADYLYVEFYGLGGISAGVILDGQHSEARTFSTPVGLKSGSLRVRFNKVSKLMTFEGSLTAPGTPYDWQKIGTFSPAGQDIEGTAKAKKKHVKANWQMNPAGGRFAVQLFGFGEKTRIIAGKTTIDYVKLSSL